MSTKIHKPTVIGIQCDSCRLIYYIADVPLGGWYTPKGSPEGTDEVWLCPEDSASVNADRAAEKKARGRKAQKRRPATKQGK